jgi:hypothetical protein
VIKFDLSDPASAYVFGFMQADGHHSARSANRGQVSIEIKAKDADVLYDMQRAIPWRTSITFARPRATNVSASYESATLALYLLEGRTRLLELGLPTGPKSKIIAPPGEPFSHSDYLRGLYDGDGSVGFLMDGRPYVSFATASPAIAAFVCDEIFRVTGRRRTARPSHGSAIANVVVMNDTAAEFARWLYGDACISMQRKREAAQAVAAWERPAGMRPSIARIAWTAAEDVIAKLGIPEKDAARRLERTVASVNSRRRKLRRLEAA